MNRHGACPCISMILAEQGIISRSEKGFTSTRSDTSHENKHKYRTGETREHCCETPEKNTDGRNPFTAEAVSCPSSYGYHESIKQTKYRGNKPH